MRTTKTYKSGLARIRKAWRTGRYERALEEVERLLSSWPDNPSLLRMRAELVQLQEETKHRLVDVRADLERAVALNEESPAALIELGHFLSTVEDNPAAASRCFGKAITLCRRFLTEALLAQADTLLEIDRKPDALAHLAEAYFLQAPNGRSAAGSAGKEILDHLKILLHST